MKVLLFALVAFGLSSGADDGGRTATKHKAHGLATLGRCSGNAYCSSCSNCSRCGHCAGGGGTCGVCAPSASSSRSTYRYLTSPSLPSYSSSSSSATRKKTTPRKTVASVPKLVIQPNYSYYIKANTLNLRSAPSTSAEVIRVLTTDDIVKVVEVVDDTWVKVTHEDALQSEVTGYVAKAYLSKR